MHSHFLREHKIIDLFLAYLRNFIVLHTKIFKKILYFLFIKQNAMFSTCFLKIRKLNKSSAIIINHAQKSINLFPFIYYFLMQNLTLKLEITFILYLFFIIKRISRTFMIYEICPCFLILIFYFFIIHYFHHILIFFHFLFYFFY